MAYTDAMIRQHVKGPAPKGEQSNRQCKLMACRMFGHIHRGQLLARHAVQKLEDQGVRMFFVGDPAYPLLPCIRTPYHSENLTTKQEACNKALGSMLEVAEQAFGRLKGRWQIVLKGMEPDRSIVVMACCVLHNVCEAQEEVFRQEWMVPVRDADSRHPQPPPPPTTESQVNAQACAVRDALLERITVF
ncbi:hypothetical protein EOD39_9505 [Acipenser ruthenus]|uniref:DDE Tnp4 domain-containing protein n=1 Tax=Acipenser ruthenus TaxID=7906 RepID=A0A444U0H9_ACIRT|nr:hypothetical protein EOD39_9505 [Acipenser ruthenus]